MNLRINSILRLEKIAEFSRENSIAIIKENQFLPISDLELRICEKCDPITLFYILPIVIYKIRKKELLSFSYERFFAAKSQAVFQFKTRELRRIPAIRQKINLDLNLAKMLQNLSEEFKYSFFIDLKNSISFANVNLPNSIKNTYHLFRHLGVTNAIERGLSKEEIVKFMGWKTSEIINCYNNPKLLD